MVTPKDHPDRVPLQLALTQLECLAENLRERKREAELRNKVKLLDGLVAQSHKVNYMLILRIYSPLICANFC